MRDTVGDLSVETVRTGGSFETYVLDPNNLPDYRRMLVKTTNSLSEAEKAHREFTIAIRNIAIQKKA